LKFKFYIFILLALSLLVHNAYAQDPSFNPLRAKYLPDSTRLDTFPLDEFEDETEPPPVIVISPDGLDAKVEYGSVDSNYLDNITRQVHLYGDAYVRYKDLSLIADYIVVDLDSSIATAQGLPDSLGKMAGLPQFQMGEESFTADKMRYNFIKRKGIIYEAETKEGDLTIHGEKTKFIAAGADSTQQNDILYGSRALITTCDHPNPHFGIRASKVKTIPDKLAVIGSSNMEIFGVPTPIWLPFGFYPVSDTRSAGLVLPRDYERSPQWGFGIRDIGYYFPISDWADMQILGDIYFNGTWGIGLVTNYTQRYKFKGNMALRYSVRKSEIPNDYRQSVEKSFSIRVTHNQDPKSNPYQTIGGSINIQSNNFESLNYNDAQSALTNTYSSNFNYSRTFPGKPYSITAAFNHSQNTQSHLVTINAPEFNFRLNRIYPFKDKKPGPEAWYEKIAFQYAGSARSQLTATDTTLFDANTWKNLQYGAQHKMNAAMNLNAFKYFSINPTVDYNETWFFKTQNRMFEFDPNDPTYVMNDTIWFPDSSGYIIQPDTISYGTVNTSLTPGFESFRALSASVNVNTQIFGTVQFQKGWLRGFRHVMKPSIGVSFTPASPNSYYQQQNFSVQYPDSTKSYSRFDNLLYSVRPNTGRQANLNYGINNIFEAKYFRAKDSTENKLKLFDNIGLGGSYNFAAEAFNFSPLNISGNTRFFKGITTFTIGASYSFYGLNPDNTLNPELYVKSNNKLLRFDNLRLRFSTRITFNDVKKLFSPESASASPEETSKRMPDKRDKLEELLSGFSINHELGIVRMGMNGPDETRVTTNNINMVGSMRLTPNWSIYFGNIGYDFLSNQITYPDIGISRDLHCWQLSFNFQPTRGTYAFNINVKPGTFDFIKLPYKRGNYDTSGGF
jgi:hypothetical protein